MKERNVQDCFIAQYFSVEKGNGGRPETWERLKEVLMDNLQKRQAGHEGRLPGGFAFSLREEDACRAVTPSVLEGLLGRFLTDARRSGTVYTPGFLVRWMAREAVSSWLESRLPSPRSGDEEAGLL